MTPDAPRGLYIPPTVLALHEVSWPARLVLSEIINLYKLRNSVWVEDEYFVERLPGMSERTVQNALKELVGVGLVERDTKQNRKPKRYLTPTTDLLVSPADSALAYGDLAQSLREASAESAGGLAQSLREASAESALLYKEESKKEIGKETDKENNTALRAASENSVFENDVENDVAFEPFWDAYGKKVDREKSARLWAKLSPPQRLAAFAQVPAYVAQWPVVKYRKNPLTWLNGKCWLDEGVPVDNPLPAPGFSAAPAPVTCPVDTSSVLDPEAVAANAARSDAAMRQRIAQRQQRQAPTAPAEPSDTP